MSETMKTNTAPSPEMHVRAYLHRLTGQTVWNLCLPHQMHPFFEYQRLAPEGIEIVPLIAAAPSPETSVVPLREQMLESALTAAVETIKDYLAYEHDGDPWKEDSRAMGEMDINDYGRDGRLDYALKLLVATEGSAR